MPSGIYKRDYNKIYTPERNKKISEANKGKILTEEHRKNISKASKGKKPSVETRIKLSEKNKQRYIKFPGLKEQISKKLKGIPTPWTTGKNCHFWKDGRCKNKEYLYWLQNKRNRVKKRINESGSSHTFGEWKLLKKQYGYICPCCGLQEPFNNQRIKGLTEDHIIPLSKGGSDYIENIQPLCQSCNSKKHTKIIKYENKL